MHRFTPLLAAAIVAAGLPVAARVAAATSAQADRPADDAVTFWVQEALREDPRVDSSPITVQTVDGIVTLSGKVEDLDARKYSELEAEKIHGVQGVINRIEVAPDQRPDFNVAQDIRRRLQDSVFIDAHDLTVTVDNGAVTLNGTVDSWVQRQWAEMLAGEVRGVRSISNHLTPVYPGSRPDGEIADDVAAAFARDVYLSGMNINVTVDGGVVTLKGSVGTPFERGRATEEAYKVPNVKNVQNDLQVRWFKQKGARQGAAPPSDKQLAENVRDELSQDIRLEPDNLNVTASSGHVTLRGAVPTNYQKQLADKDVRDVVGVGWVTNLLTVEKPNRTDREIREDILAAVASDSALDGQDVEVKVDNSVVLLSGSVDQASQKTHAGEIVSRVPGVTKVVNKLQVTPTPQLGDPAIKKSIQDRLLANAETHDAAGLIHVDVHDGRVTLTGNVNFWSDRDQAGSVASNTAGVSSVDNQLKVTGP